jgi:membrane protein
VAWNLARGANAARATLRARSEVGLAGMFCAGLLVGVGLSIGEPAGRSKDEDAPRSWLDVVGLSVRAFSADRIPAAAAAVTFYFLLALFPALSAFASLYGLIANVKDAERQIGAMAGVLPGGAISVVGDALTRLTATDHGALGLAFAVSLVVSIWSANAAIKALIDGLNVAYEAHERRNFVKLTLVSLALTVGIIAAAIVGLALLAAAPPLLARLHLAGLGLSALRWPVLLVTTAVFFSVLYRFAPCRPASKLRWITPGGCVAALGWVIVSALFSWYVGNFGHYDRTYGSLGAVVGFLTWVWLSTMVLLYGAELNAAAEARSP